MTSGAGCATLQVTRSPKHEEAGVTLMNTEPLLIPAHCARRSCKHREAHSLFTGTYKPWFFFFPSFTFSTSTRTEKMCSLLFPTILFKDFHALLLLFLGSLSIKKHPCLHNRKRTTPICRDRLMQHDQVKQFNILAQLTNEARLYGQVITFSCSSGVKKSTRYFLQSNKFSISGNKEKKKQIKQPF